MLLNQFHRALFTSPPFLRLLQSAAQQASFHGTPGNKAQPIFTAGRNHFQLDSPGCQVIQALFRNQSQEVALLRLTLGTGNVPALKIAAPHVKNFPFADQLFHCLPDLLPGSAAIDVMHLIKVDHVRLQAAQASFASLADMVSGQMQIVRTIPHCVVNLGRQNHLVPASAALGQPTPDNLFRNPLAHFPAIHVGGVEKIDSHFQRFVHQGKAVFFSGMPAEIHCAET